MTREWFSNKVETLVQKEHISYMDAVLEICEIYDMEPALGATFISPSIKQHIMVEAVELNMYKDSTSALPGMRE